jgi:hypothetical protein
MGSGLLLAAGDDQQKAAPLGLFVLLLLGVTCYFLFRSMSRHLKRVREDFPIDATVPGSLGAPSTRPTGPTWPSEAGPSGPTGLTETTEHPGAGHSAVADSAIVGDAAASAADDAVPPKPH